LRVKLEADFDEGFMRFHLMLVSAALLVGSLGAPVVATATRFPVCNFGVTKAWRFGYGSEAYSNGPCAGAVVTIVVRAQNGKVVWTDAMPASQLMTFVDAKTPTQMKAALLDWLAQPHVFKSSGDLPVWNKGADAPVAGEFPFYPEGGVDRDTYMQIRAEKQAMFCYVQGMESMACVAIAKDGAATKVGVQSFPG
jgi:hypothetical protein